MPAMKSFTELDPGQTPQAIITTLFSPDEANNFDAEKLERF